MIDFILIWHIVYIELVYWTVMRKIYKKKKEMHCIK